MYDVYPYSHAYHHHRRTSRCMSAISSDLRLGRGSSDSLSKQGARLRMEHCLRYHECTIAFGGVYVHSLSLVYQWWLTLDVVCSLILNTNSMPLFMHMEYNGARHPVHISVPVDILTATREGKSASSHGR